MGKTSRPQGYTCMTLPADGTGFEIELIQTGINKFAVVYGEMVTKDLSYAEAAAELGSGIMHRISCGGRLDNRNEAEAWEAGDRQPYFDAPDLTDRQLQLHAAYYRAMVADLAWQAELDRVYGKLAGDARYDMRGEATETLKRLRETFHKLSVELHGLWQPTR